MDTFTLQLKTAKSLFPQKLIIIVTRVHGRHGSGVVCLGLCRVHGRDEAVVTTLNIIDSYSGKPLQANAGMQGTARTSVCYTV